MLLDRFRKLDLRQKISLVLIGMALVLGAVVFLILGIVSYHLVSTHGQSTHFVEFLLPLFSIIGIVVITGLIYFAGFVTEWISAPLREASATAEKASNLLREAVQHVAVGFTIYDENDRLAICNEAYLHIYKESRDLIVPGASFEEIVRQGAKRGQYQAALGNVDEWVRQRVALHQSARGEVIEQKLGDGRWLMIVEHRTPGGYIVGNRIDITELKNTSEALRERELYLRDRNEQLDAIFNLSPDGFVSFDRAGHVKYASPAFLRMTGFEMKSIVGLDEAAFSALLAGACLETARFPGLPALHRHLKVGAGGMKSPEAVTATDTGESPRLLIELADSQKRILEIGLRESQAETVSQILYFRDVTHEKEVERMKSEFLATAAHELRTPMASIYGFTELLLNQDFGEEERSEFLATIFKQSELMVSIINELLDLARIEARRGKDFHIDCLSLHHLVHDVVISFKPPAGRSAPRVAPCDNACWVRADPKKLAQAIGNVLSNAYKYSPAGGDVEIDFVIPAPGALDEDGQPAPFGIRVTDHGIGMTAQQLARVFERFYRADTSGKIPGTGLGMSIVKEIIELLNGRIDIASQFGQGSQVTLWLPASPPEKTTS
jgi:signal transduction histidine kinase